MRSCFLICLLALMPVCSRAVVPANEFVSRVSGLESKHGGRLGVAVISTNGMPLFSYRSNERFAMCSTFKALLAALVLSRVDKGQESLEREIRFASGDILDYAPITKERLGIGHMTVRELNAASVQYSDNTAANLLLKEVGGPAALTKYLRSIGDRTTRLDRNEPSLNTNLPDDPRDTSTPAAMSRTLQKRKNGEVFPMETNVDVVHDDHGAVLHHVMVFHDATVQKQLEDRLRELSATDGLTLVANRRMFDEVMEREWNRAMRHKQPVSLIMADIDMFKSYNDLYGHMAGDECLRKVAQAISDSAQRGSDLVARYGGEEFAVILPNTDEAAAREIAEKIRDAVEKLNIPHDGNVMARHITISLGTSTRVPPQTNDFIGLMQSADKALYRAKESGRNSVAS